MKNFLIAIFYFSFVSANCDAQTNKLPFTKNKTVVIAHRGNHVQVPENTLAAMQAAINCGADYVEMDLRTTKDGHLIIMHDASLLRTTGHNGMVKDFTYEALKKITILPKDKSDTATYRIPDFLSALQLCKNRINIYLDFKDADVNEAYRLIKQAGMELQVIVYVGNDNYYTQWRKVAPQMPLMKGISKEGDFEKLKKDILQKPISLTDNAYDKKTIDLLHSMNIKVWLDVQSSDEGPAQWQKALSLGADGLQTDHPEDFIKYLKQKNIR